MEKIEWFALATSYCRELTVKKYFAKRDLETYVPMKCGYTEVDGRCYREWIPAMHNLLFVRSTRKYLQSAKTALEGSKTSFRWVIDINKKQPVIIPDRQMQNFMKVCSTGEDGLLFYERYDENRFKAGDYVKVMAGPFKDVEGRLVRIKKNRCVLVNLNGVAAVATTFIHPSFLQVIEEKK